MRIDVMDPLKRAGTRPGDMAANRVRQLLLAALIQLAQGMAELIQHSERPWSSVTFSGARHVVVLQFTGLEAVAAGEVFIAELEEHEFTLPRTLVADACIAAADHEVAPIPRLTVTAELLLLDED